jgi:citrate synthase
VTDDWLQTAIGGATPDTISVRGRNLADDLMGQVTFTELAFLLVQGRAPSAAETRLLDAVLVSLADHGLTPTALAARLTLTGAPESLQGAVAAGLLGAGSVFLGVVEDTARFLAGILDDDADVAAAVTAARAAGRRIPGLGHPLHKRGDPRTPRLYAIAREGGIDGPYLKTLLLVAEEHERQSGRPLPINGAGVAGAALADLGFDPGIVRGFALLARTAGLVGHLAEERERPLGMRLYQEVERRGGHAAGA